MPYGAAGHFVSGNGIPIGITYMAQMIKVREH